MRDELTIVQHGEWTETEKFLERCLHIFKSGVLDKYGEWGVAALEYYTPKRTGLTAASWGYDVKIGNDTIEIHWTNTNIQNGQNVALILQTGHATANGGYFQGIDYINPALEPVFEAIAEDAQNEIEGLSDAIGTSFKTAWNNGGKMAFNFAKDKALDFIGEKEINYLNKHYTVK